MYYYNLWSLLIAVISIFGMIRHPTTTTKNFLVGRWFNKLIKNIRCGISHSVKFGHFLSIWENFLVLFAQMFAHPISINPCHLTSKALITLVLTIYSLPTYLPAWVFRLFHCVLPQKSYFFSHLFYFFISFLFFFFHFFFHQINFFFLCLNFHLVQELFIDVLKIILTVYFIVKGSLRSKGLLLLLMQL